MPTELKRPVTGLVVTCAFCVRIADTRPARSVGMTLARTPRAMSAHARTATSMMRGSSIT